MSAGRLGDAIGWNRGGPALYLSAWIWLAAFMTIAPRRIYSHLIRKDQIG